MAGSPERRGCAMRCLIAYPTAEGQTRQFCCFAAEHLVSCGHSGDFLTVADIEALADHRFDADPCRVCSRGRGGARSAWLSRAKTLYLQVWLLAAGHDPRECAESARIADGFAGDPGRVAGRPEQSPERSGSRSMMFSGRVRCDGTRIRRAKTSIPAATKKAPTGMGCGRCRTLGLHRRGAPPRATCPGRRPRPGRFPGASGHEIERL